MNYKNINDYEVLYLIEDENDSYKKIIYQKYKPIIKKLCAYYKQLYKNIMIDEDELYQEAFLGVDYAISHFDYHKDITFYTFCVLCIKSKIKDYYSVATAKKNNITTSCISLDKLIQEDVTLYDMIPSQEDVCKTVIFNDDINKIIEFKNELPPKESQIFELRINGFTYKEIAQLLSISVGSVYSHVRNIKKKYQSIYEV